MRNQSKAEIDNARDFFEKNQFKKVDVEVGGRRFSYFVLPQSLNPELPNFVFRMTCGNSEEGQLYGIADSVDERFRGYAVFHEVVEFTEIGMEREGRCVRALKLELQEVPDDLRKEYADMRTEFFRDLLKYAQAHPADYSEADLQEFRGALERLESI